MQRQHPTLANETAVLHSKTADDDDAASGAASGDDTCDNMIIAEDEPPAKPEVRRRGRPRKYPIGQSPRQRRRVAPKAKRLTRESDGAIDPREEHNRKERVRRAFIGRSIGSVASFLARLNDAACAAMRNDKVRVIHLSWELWRNIKEKLAPSDQQQLLDHVHRKSQCLNNFVDDHVLLQEMEAMPESPLTTTSSAPVQRRKDEAQQLPDDIVQAELSDAMAGRFFETPKSPNLASGIVVVTSSLPMPEEASETNDYDDADNDSIDTV